MNTKKMFKAFTLVEMLIVIVIIGLLSRALIPRLTSARARANDAARKADLRQITTALTMYQMDKGIYPDSSPIFNEASALPLSSAGLKNIPIDPIKSVIAMDPYGSPGIVGSYVYVSLWKRGVYNQSFVLISIAETEGGANWVYDSSKDIYADSSPCNQALSYCDAEDISSHICNKIAKGTDVYNGGTGYCTYTTLQDLRYVFLSP